MKITFAGVEDVGVDEDTRGFKLKSLPDIVNQKEIISLVREVKRNEFFYMVYAVSRASVNYTPYCLTYV